MSAIESLSLQFKLMNEQVTMITKKVEHLEKELVKRAEWPGKDFIPKPAQSINAILSAAAAAANTASRTAQAAKLLGGKDYIPIAAQAAAAAAPAAAATSGNAAVTVGAAVDATVGVAIAASAHAAAVASSASNVPAVSAANAKASEAASAEDANDRNDGNEVNGQENEEEYFKKVFFTSKKERIRLCKQEFLDILYWMTNDKFLFPAAFLPRFMWPTDANDNEYDK